MRRLRITIEDLFEQLRQKMFFPLQDVAYAIMETNGKISVIKTLKRHGICRNAAITCSG